MNENQIKFDKFVKDNGGIYIPESDSEVDILLRTMLVVGEKYTSEISNQKTQLPKANIYYINDWENINACAFVYQDEHFIGINVAAVLQLKDVFDMIFESDKIYENGFFVKDKKIIYSPLFLYFSVMFLVGHEYSHIRFGHCNLLMELYGTGISEISGDALLYDGLFSQTLEYDADCCTIANLTNRLLYKANKNLDVLAEDLSFCMLACYIMFKIFDNGKHTRFEDYQLEDLVKSTHPRPGLRQHYLAANISTILFKNLSMSQADFVINQIVEVIKYFELTLSETVKLGNLEMGIAYTEKGSRHLNLIHNNWKYVRELLMKHSYDQLAPYEELQIIHKLIDK